MIATAPPLNLAAIIDSWERLSTASMDDYSDQGRLNHLRLLARFRDQHFTTLLAVARAAVKMRAFLNTGHAYEGECPDAVEPRSLDPTNCRCCAAIVAFDAAAAGADEGEGRG